MKSSFFAGAKMSLDGAVALRAADPAIGHASPAAVSSGARTSPATTPETNYSRPRETARIAVYDAAGAAPRVEEVAPVETGEYISLLATRTFELARALGGRVPFTVISEVVENYIHASFRGPVVTILDSGNTIRFSDQGPGIKDKLRAVEPGYTTASPGMKRYIRGVGSGLPLARECLSFSDGSLEVEDNLGAGAVITVSVARPSSASAPVPGIAARLSGDASWAERTGEPLLSPPAGSEPALSTETLPFHAPLGAPRLSNRQKRVLALVMDAGSAGPSLVARELAIGLSTAYRDLARLEALGLIASDDSGKRTLTDSGADYLLALLNSGM